ncbi:MAG: MMPL family transporter [Proteobacteria bacterium]|nr:MMPL family transporter [Pseudomonadota bacterium]
MKDVSAQKQYLGTGPKQISGNRFFRAFTILVLRYRWSTLILTLAVTVFMGYSVATRLEINTTVEGFLSSDSETAMALEELRDQFGQDTVFQILIGGDVFSMPYLSRLKKLHDELAAIDLEIESLGQRSNLKEGQQNDLESASIPKQARKDDEFGEFGDTEGWGDEGGGTIIDEIISLINVRQTSWTNGGLRVDGLLAKWPSASELPEIKRKVLSNRTLVGQVIDKDATHSVIVLRTAFMSEQDQGLVHKEIARITEAHQADDFKIMISGMPAILVTLDHLMLSDIATTLLVVNLITLVILLIMFRHPIGVIGPILVVWLAEIWTMGVMALTDMPVTMVTTILPAFLACVGLGDSVHIQSVYRDARRDGMSNYDAIIHAVETTGIPVFYTTLTTAVGLMSFRLASLEAIGDMGMFGALGVTFAFLNSVVFLPIVLSVNKKSLLGLPTTGEKLNRIDRFLQFCDGLSRPSEKDGKQVFKKRNRVLLAAAGLAIVAGLGVSLLRVYHDVREWLPEDNHTLKALTAFEDTVGGTSNIALLVKAKQGEDLRDREVLLALERLEKYILAYEDKNNPGKIVSNTTSLLDPIRESWRAVNGEKEEFYKLPDTQRGISDMLTLFEQTGPDQLKRHVSIDMERALIVARTQWMEALSYVPLAKYLEQGIEKLIGDRASIITTGTVYVQLAVVSALVMDLLRSFGAAIFVITIIMVILLKDFKLGVMAMIPNLLPIFSVMGLMGFTSIPLDVNTILLGSVAIGIAVDDTIHLLHQFRIHYNAHGQVDQAIQHALNHAGRAMVITSLILVFSFICMLMGDLSFVRWFGKLVSAIVALALILDLCLTPALLRVFYKSRT